MAYDKNLDYSLLIKAAEEAGDYSAAAIYEQQRNEKIADMNKSGTNTGGWAQTNKYQTTTTPASTAPAGYTGSSNAVGINTQQQQAIKDKMNSNSIGWHTADEATKKQLEEENKQLAAQLGGSVTFDPNTGYWSGEAAAHIQPSFNYDTGSRPTYNSNYNDRIDALLNQILSREDFSYNVNEDQLYQQYKNQYQREGQRAMNDTLASAAAGAGGMNSYAITAAQQANDYYSTQLTDKIPELYQLAYEMYLQDIDNQVRDLGLLQDMDNAQYNRYRDTMSDWENDRNFAYNQYRDDVSDQKWQTEFDYGVSRDEVSDGRYDREWDYMEKQDAYERAMDMIAMGITPDIGLLSLAGLSAAEATAAIAAKQTTGSGGNETSKDDGSLDYEGLFQAAYESGNPRSWLAQKANYQKYGFTSPSGLYDDYVNWEANRGAPENADFEQDWVNAYYNELVNSRNEPFTSADDGINAAMTLLSRDVSLEDTQLFLRKMGVDITMEQLKKLAQDEGLWQE